MWVLYLALEPYVRRYWPQAMISWTRALGGRWRDPLVGRDVLYGVVLGVLSAISMASVIIWSAARRSAVP